MNDRKLTLICKRTATSGGYFNYGQEEIRNICDDLSKVISKNKSTESDAQGDRIETNFSNEVIKELTDAITILKKAYIYAHRIDWLLSGDDSEHTFLTRLKHDLKESK